MDEEWIRLECLNNGCRTNTILLEYRACKAVHTYWYSRFIVRWYHRRYGQSHGNDDVSHKPRYNDTNWYI